MSHQLRILQTGTEIAIEPNETVLQAAKKNQIPYPHSCSSGRCGSCKSRLISGQIKHLSHNPATLDEEEKSLGLFLACRSLAESDLKVSWLEESQEHLPIQTFQSEVSELSDLTHDIRRVVIRIPNDIIFQFKPGQFVEIAFRDLRARSYSIANQPGDGFLEFFIRYTPGGLSSTFAHKELKVGDRVQIQGPFGQAFLRTDHTGPILAVAGGSGLAPIRSILASALQNGFRQPVHFYFGVRSGRDLFLSEELNELSRKFPNFKFVPILDEVTEGFRSGRVGDAILEDWRQFEGLWQAYLAGPPPMIETLTPKLLERGIRKHNLFLDPFNHQYDVSNSKSG